MHILHHLYTPKPLVLIHIFHQNRIEHLKVKISTSVVNELVIVANDATATNINRKELSEKLLVTTDNAFKRLEPQINELLQLTGSSPEVLSKDLSGRINQNQAFRDALPKGGGISPRSAGVLRQIGYITHDIAKNIKYIVPVK